jgi:CMP-N-acetylneuraminic acid synthetase
MLAIIPARGGSKGVPRKNVRELCGKPLIVWTIESAKVSTNIDMVVVSTDDEEIAEISRKAGAEVPFMRPAKLARDDSLAIDTYIYTIERLNNEFGFRYESFVTLQPTTPLRSVYDIDKSIKLFEDKQADSVISGRLLEHPAEWVYQLGSEGQILSSMDDDSRMNRQQGEKYYLPNGAVLILQYKMLKETRTYFSARTYSYIMPAERSIDIDTELDFRIAELILTEVA